MIELRIIKKKKYFLVETILEVHTNVLSYTLYINMKRSIVIVIMLGLVKKQNHRLHKKLGFLTGPYIKIVSPKYYINELSESLITEDGLIDLKKKYTYK